MRYETLIFKVISFEGLGLTRVTQNQGLQNCRRIGTGNRFAADRHGDRNGTSAPTDERTLETYGTHVGSLKRTCATIGSRRAGAAFSICQREQLRYGKEITRKEGWGSWSDWSISVNQRVRDGFFSSGHKKPNGTMPIYGRNLWSEGNSNIGYHPRGFPGVELI
ncbi:hypothetical protein BGW80DRAFT_1250739 [Lactifluus volemus]|nr:hypothetical protein BGW80DRAFT_1250739 [Lactifluus volemus]